MSVPAFFQYKQFAATGDRSVSLLDSEAVSWPLTQAEVQGGSISENLRAAALSKDLKASPAPNPQAKSPRSSGDRKISNCQSPAAHPHTGSVTLVEFLARMPSAVLGVVWSP